MSEISDSQLRRLDGTLLLVFEETMATGKLSAAASRLGLTQSAISHALRRLRDVFGDELFVRLPHGVRPTARAEALRAPLAEVTRALAAAIQPARFDPRGGDRVFRIAAQDYTTAMFAAGLTNGLELRSGPRFIFRSLVREAALAALRTAEVDVALGLFAARGEGFLAERLFEEDYLVVARAGHPALAEALTQDTYCSAGHVLVAPGGTLEGIVDRALAAAGRARRVVLSVPYFLAALAAVARTDLIATLPRRIAARHAPDFGLVTLPPPLPIRRFSISMVWTRREGADPGHVWLRDRIKSVAGACRPVNAHDVSVNASSAPAGGPTLVDRNVTARACPRLNRGVRRATSQP
jgi:DNA-binding transcriptional LysR family regulator